MSVLHTPAFTAPSPQTAPIPAAGRGKKGPSLQEPAPPQHPLPAAAEVTLGNIPLFSGPNLSASICLGEYIRHEQSWGCRIRPCLGCSGAHPGTATSLLANTWQGAAGQDEILVHLSQLRSFTTDFSRAGVSHRRWWDSSWHSSRELQPGAN